jgi:hypothetical protein
LNEALQQADGTVKHAMKFAHSSLAEQQVRTIEMLEDLSFHGGSISKDPEGQSCDSTSVSVSKMSVPPGLSSPPGLAAPPGLSSSMACLKAPARSLSIARLLSMRSQVPLTQSKYRLKTLPAASLMPQGNESTMRPDAQEFAPVVKGGSLALSPTAEEFVPSVATSVTTLSLSAKEFVPEALGKSSCQPLVNAAFFDDDESDFEDVNSTCSASSAFTSDAWDSE